MLPRLTLITGCRAVLFTLIRYIRWMDRDIERILISRELIAGRMRELAKLMIDDHHRAFGTTTEITIVPVLTGAMIFCGDLIREMPIAMKIGLLTVSSYPGRSMTSQAHR